MEQRLDRIEKQLDRMNEHLMEYNAQLSVHIEGTIQNRNHITKVEKVLEGIVVHVNEVQGMVKFIKFVAAAVAFTSTLLGILKMFEVI